jgi:hypothetical protein
MEQHSFKIEGAYFKKKCFPWLNDLLHEAEKSPFAYNKDKKTYTVLAINAIRKGLKGWAPNGRVALHYEFGEPIDGHYRDYDNIAAAGRKIINDALVMSKVLKDDKPMYLAYGSNSFVYTKGKPYIKVTFEEVSDLEIKEE